MFSLARSQFFGILALYGVISRYVMRSYHLHEHFYDLEMTLPATVCECVCVDCPPFEMITTNPNTSQRISLSLSRKNSPNRIFVCAKCIFMAHNRILRVCLYMRMWLHDNSNNNFIFWANLFSHAWMKCFHFSFFSFFPFIPKSITHSCFRKAYRLEWHD